MIAFRSQFENSSPLDEIVRTGSQQILQTAIDAEVSQFLQLHVERGDERGNRLVVRSGYLPAREILTGAGRLELQQLRERDNTPDKSKRVTFSSSISPPYFRRSKND